MNKNIVTAMVTLPPNVNVQTSCNLTRKLKSWFVFEIPPLQLLPCKVHLPISIFLFQHAKSNGINPSYSEVKFQTAVLPAMSKIILLRNCLLHYTVIAIIGKKETNIQKKINFQQKILWNERHQLFSIAACTRMK